MVAIVAIVFIAEYAIMLVVSLWTNTTPLLNFINAAALALLVAPPIYWLVLRPLQREHEKLLRAESNVEALSRFAITDPLTQIMNRRGITVGLLDAMAQAERYATPLTVAMVDVDFFKKVNDSHGHEAGDKVLKEVAAILTDALRMPDKVGRYGGEEFLIIFPHTTLVQARKIADRIRVSVSKWEFDTGSKKLNLTISLGVVQYAKGEDLEQLLSRADKAMYAAKHGGRNRVVAHKSG